MRGVAPLQQLGADCNWDKNTVRRPISLIGFSVLGLQDLSLDLPGERANDQGRRDDGFRFKGRGGAGKLAGEGVWLGVFAAGSEGDGKIEAAEEELPASLLGV